eukprot:6313513-Ditylum_brightwellii.AAC.1
MRKHNLAFAGKDDSKGNSLRNLYTQKMWKQIIRRDENGVTLNDAWEAARKREWDVDKKINKMIYNEQTIKTIGEKMTIMGGIAN